jgi:4-hydroxy-2-oxoheptanedioate aldolase
MNPLKNSFKTALAEGQPQIGLWLGLANSYTAELCGRIGYDWLLVDGEHAPNDLRSILGQLQAIEATASHPVVRPVVGDVTSIKQLLDIGAQNLLIPMVESGAQARQLVAAVRYPPAGIRGVGSALARASHFNLIPDYLPSAADHICLLLQVESRAGLEHLDEIAATDGVDGVFIGPSDLAAALGHLGRPDHPEVQAVIEHAIGRIRSAGKAPGILTSNETAAHHYLALGATFVAVGTDVGVLVKGTQGLLQKFKHAPSSGEQEHHGY